MARTSRQLRKQKDAPSEVRFGLPDGKGEDLLRVARSEFLPPTTFAKRAVLRAIADGLKKLDPQQSPRED